MKLKALRTYFNSELLGYYPDTEIASFFQLLSKQILNLKRIDITLNLNELISGENYNEFQSAIERLKNYEPIQYILGETEFFGLKFKVDKSVLIPRPETEELVSLVIDTVSSSSVDKSLRILDIGTGSGCIAISLAKNLPNAKVSALDVSQEALEVAQENAKLNEVEVEFIESNILSICHAELDSVSQKWDIIVSNPPYVRQQEKSEIKKNVLDNEPHLALFVEDNDALQFYKAICGFAVDNLSENGLLFFEINEYLGKEMIELLEKYNFKNIELKQDIFGKDRMIKSQKLEA